MQDHAKMPRTEDAAGERNSNAVRELRQGDAEDVRSMQGRQLPLEGLPGAHRTPNTRGVKTEMC